VADEERLSRGQLGGSRAICLIAAPTGSRTTTGAGGAGGWKQAVALESGKNQARPCGFGKELHSRRI